jgi:hypothetical protein
MRSIAQRVADSSGRLRGLIVCWVLVLAVLASTALGSSPTNFQTPDRSVYCGVAMAVYGTESDPGTGAPENGMWPGLQCGAEGIPNPHPREGDPFVQLGQGRAGRAHLVDESQNDLVSGSNPVTLAPGATWKRVGISCTIERSSVSCKNSSGHGFTLSTGHVKTF